MTTQEQTAVLLVGHGAVATDTPPAQLERWRSLRGARRAGGGPAGQEERDLEASIRGWPRRPDNDPYHAGLMRIAEALRARVAPRRVATAFNELCDPGIGEAIAAVVAAGCERVQVVTTMITPGGGHSERDIPRALEAARVAHPHVQIDYAWPLDVGLVADMLAAAVER